MGKKALIILVSLLFIQSCSWITDIFVLNKSTEGGKSVKLFDICCSYTGVKEDTVSEDSDIKQEDDSNAYELTIKSAHETIHTKGIKLLRAFKKKDKTTNILKHEG